MNTSTTPSMPANEATTTEPLTAQSDPQSAVAADSRFHAQSPATSPSPAYGSQPTSNPQTPPPASILSPSGASGSNTSPAVISLAINLALGSSPDATPSTPEVDPQIIEALKSKDRIYVLKLGELMEGLIKEKRSRVDLTPATSYQRLLVHRCSAYYKLAPENDPTTKGGIFVHPTPESRIPERRICELVPPESSSQPAFKIMRRSGPGNRYRQPSQAGSVTGEDGDLSDGDPSEAGSLGGRSNATGGSNKKHMTIQEREVAYNEARSRIFMDFEEKEKAKEKDMSASSSSLSLTSASVSSVNGDASSSGDVDESIGSPTTESEWSGTSGQFSRERKDNRRGGSGNASTSSSTRSIRSGGGNYHGNGSNPSSRNSRASSPSFTYASLYEPAPSQQLYDPNQPPSQSNPSYGTQYYHPFAPPSQQYMPPYPGYYPPYNPYQQLPHEQHQHPSSDPSAPRNIEHYPPQPMNYPWVWHQPNQPPSMQSPGGMQPMPPQPHPTGNHPVPSPSHSSAQYPYMPPPGYGSYPMPGYYPPPPPPGQQMVPQPHPPSQMGMRNQLYEVPRSVSGPPSSQPGGNPGAQPNGHSFNPNGRGPINNGVLPSHANGRNSPSRSNIASGPPVNGNNGNKSRNPPAIARNPWSYGPGVSTAGYTVPPSTVKSEVIAPRLTTSRRQSNVSGGSSTANSRASSNNDDGLSTTSSSTTSSSSRRTYTSTTSSQHPLPARPDWAVGLKAQPTLASRHIEHPGSRHLPSMSSPRSLNGNPSQTPPVTLQSTDFPPLTSAAVAEKKNPIPSGAWGNAANRSILVAAGQNSGEDERTPSHASPKGADVPNPRLVRRPINDNSMTNRDKDATTMKHGDYTSNGNNGNNMAAMITQMQVMSIEEKIAAIETRAALSEAAAVAAGSASPAGTTAA